MRLKQGVPRSVGPAAWVRQAACAACPDRFNESAGEEAVAVCAYCPVLEQCREWALHNAVDSVAGGMTLADRQRWRAEHDIAEPVICAEDYMPIRVNGSDLRRLALHDDAILDAVARWTRVGETGKQIARRLGCSRRNVCRMRAQLRDDALAG